MARRSRAKVALSLELMDKELDEVAVALAGGHEAILAEVVLPIVYECIAENFAGQHGPDGSIWPPRKKRPGDDGHPLLDDTGKLKGAATGMGGGILQRIEGNQLVIGVDSRSVRYAAVHQYGYPEKNIPQREYLGLSQEAQERIAKAVAERLKEEVFLEGV